MRDNPCDGKVVFLPGNYVVDSWTAFTSKRPTSRTDLGFGYFDTDINRMVWRKETGWSELAQERPANSTPSGESD